MTERVLILAGGTGGHIYPALAVAEILRARGIALAWLGSARGLEQRIVPAHGIELLTIWVSGLRGRGWLGWLLAPLMLGVATAQALRIIWRFRPGVVLGMGGFVSGPGGFAAWLLRRPLVIHEQNALAGLTNRCLSRLATRVLQAYPHSFAERVAALVTGNPLRAAIAQMATRPAPPRADTTLRVLVMGGSRGAHRLNQLLPEAFAAVAVGVVEVWHQTGEVDLVSTRAAYSRAGIAARIDSYIEDMPGAYAWADVAICRAGAMTVAELAAAGLPAVLVPFPAAVDDHQTANARYLADAGAAVLLPEATLRAADLARWLDAWQRDRAGLLAMAERARALARPEAAQAVAAHCLDLLHG